MGRAVYFGVLWFLKVLVLGGEDNSVARYTEQGFRLPEPNRELPFPETHGSHPEYLFEWWYITGHLFAGDRRFGYQATFFRRAYPKDGKAAVSPEFGADQLYLAHMALSDVENETFYFEERLNRDGWDASAEEGHMDVRNGNWSLVMTDPETEEMLLHFTVRGEVEAKLSLQPERLLVRFGEDGLSRKGEDSEAVSYYLSFTHLRSEGTLIVEGVEFDVEGLSWMDHEIASRQLGEDLEGWDWMAVHFDDGSALKAYQLRQPGGSPDPWSAFIWFDEENQKTTLYAEDFEWRRVGYWESSQTGTRYPVEVELSGDHPVNGKPFNLRIEPYFPEQEITGELGGTGYWEGACRVIDLLTGKTIGQAYMELVGYQAPVSATLR
ncbi:MAG: hypothetical protein JJT75_04995 [Opitutales bacterium]|nr:hypothetical protein [Opitutales bacterium]MCH8541098.1 hypothetical protein [Opitutales bacterium]